MKTIIFGGTEKQLYNLQDVYEQCEKDKPEEVEIRVYMVDTHSLLSKPHWELTDDKFMGLAEEQGTVFTLEKFQEDFNIGKVDIIHSVIRFIPVPLFV